MLRFSFLSTKDLTLNDLRVALLNYIVSKQQDNKFIIRVEDIENSLNGKEQDNLDILKKFSIREDILIYQSENIKTYQNFAYKLLKENKAFACFCNSKELSKQEIYNNKCLNLNNTEIEELKSKKIPFRIRIKAPKDENVLKDKFIDSFIILNENGNPTQEFATAIDDMIGAITTLIIDKDSLISSIKQKYIQNELGYDTSTLKYIYLPKIEESNNYTIKELLKKGFLPDAIINYLLTIDSQVKKDIFYLPDTIKWFDINKITQKSIKFDLDKLKYFNRKHLEIMDSKKLSSIFGFADSDIGELLKLYLDKFTTLNELEEVFKPIFKAKKCNFDRAENIKLLSKIIQKAPIINSFSDFKKYLEQNSNLKGKDLEEALRFLLTGSKEGPNLEKIYPLIKSYILEVTRCH